MILNEHKKHTALAKPHIGTFARNEWAILGTHCSAIKTLASELITALSNAYKCMYADADHKNTENSLNQPDFLEAGAFATYTDKISYQQFNYKHAADKFHLRELCKGADIVFVNGNHHTAKAQVVVIDETKKDSLKKRAVQLTNVQLILLPENNNEIFDFVKKAIPDWNMVKTYHIDETEKIALFFELKMQEAIPVLNGLVLAGGKSRRMGFDKTQIKWHGKKQVYHVAEILKDFCSEVFISCRHGQQTDNDHYKTIEDTFTGLGPYGAILSAFREHPDRAFLVAATDLPLLDRESIANLIDNRRSASIATTFESPADGLPEPLITIWEPKSYPVLLSFLAQGYSCPRKVLCNSDITLIKAKDAEALINVNFPEDYENAKKLIANRPIYDAS